MGTEFPGWLRFIGNKYVMSSNIRGEVQLVTRARTSMLSICQGLNQDQLLTKMENHLPINRAITHLNLSNNHIQSVTSIPFTKITHLNLSRCMLGEGCVISLEGLVRLDLSHNCLPEVPEISSLLLKHLNVSSNRISKLGSNLLKFQSLEELKCFNNQLRVFEVSLLRRRCCRNTDIVRIIRLEEMGDVEKGEYSARYLIERSHPVVGRQLLETLMLESLNRQYQVGIEILAERVQRDDRRGYLEYCSGNNLNASLETLLIAFEVQEEYSTCRVQSLNPQLFHTQNQLSIKNLIDSLEENIGKNPDKCKAFVRHLVSLGHSLLSSDNLLEVLSIATPKTIFLLLQSQHSHLEELSQVFENSSTLKYLLQLDHPGLIRLLLKTHAFRKVMQNFLFHFSISTMLTPKHKIYKLLLKLQKEMVEHQISKKVCIFKEYECVPSASLYTTTPMYSCGDTEEMLGYHHLQDPDPLPAEVVLRLNQGREDKENQPLSVGEQVDHKIRYSLPNRTQKLGLTLRKEPN